MNYKLAKQLKDAGFPQEVKQGRMLTESIDEEQRWAEDCYVPTLSELIEACGNRFSDLQLNGTKENIQWLAAGYKNVGDDGRTRTYGKTPEIAVSKLWLKLNKK